MNEAGVQLRNLVLIVLCPIRYPKVVRLGSGSIETSFKIDDEQFSEITSNDFFGFYDWLRPGQGKIIGVYVHWDDSEDRDLGIAELMGVEIISPPEWQGAKDLKIMFGRQTTHDENLSCDQDFGDNGIYHGSRGSVALAFNAPPEDDVIVQEPAD